MALSDSTSYASSMSANLSLASADLFRSGWNFFAKRRKAFLTSDSVLWGVMLSISIGKEKYFTVVVFYLHQASFVEGLLLVWKYFIKAVHSTSIIWNQFRNHFILNQNY